MGRNNRTAFGAMVKPVGAACNLSCNYCYYLDKELQYNAPPKVMSREMLEEFIQQYIEGNTVPVVSFCWHGGEPLMAGLDFFREAMELQKKYAGEKSIENSVQTNATLLTAEWCDFFAENNFLVGVSIDGPQHVHDANRIYHDGRPTFERVMQGIERLQRAGAEYNTLSAVGHASEGRGVEIYRFLKSIGSRFMQFLPVLEHVKEMEGYARPVIVNPSDEGARLADWSVSSRGYGRFLVDVFDEWVVQDVGEYYVQMFDATLAGWCGVRPGICSLCESCGDALVVEHNGDVYSCDHFVYPEYRLGNIASDHLKSMFRSSAQLSFGLSKRNSLPGECRRCEYRHLCNGECPKHRFVKSAFDEQERINSLCDGFRYFYRHSRPYMEFMRDCLAQGRAAAEVMPMARERMGLIF